MMRDISPGPTREVTLAKPPCRKSKPIECAQKEGWAKLGLIVDQHEDEIEYGATIECDPLVHVKLAELHIGIANELELCARIVEPNCDHNAAAIAEFMDVAAMGRDPQGSGPHDLPQCGYQQSLH
ncbi:MAG: hypothetical protein ACKVP7_07805 [Hyphomicrobiaceae bacterium]